MITSLAEIERLPYGYDAPFGDDIPQGDDVCVGCVMCMSDRVHWRVSNDMKREQDGKSTTQ